MLPVPILDLARKADRRTHENLIKAANEILALQESLEGGTTEHERAVTQRQTNSTDRQIDQLVYELYGLTDKEIRIVEEATG